MRDPGEHEDFQEIAQRHENQRERAERFGGAYVEDFVLGANDGIITSFAVVSGATGGALGVAVVIIIGFANLFADSVSMGSSAYLARMSRSAYIRGQRSMLEWEITHRPEEKRKELEERLRERGILNCGDTDVVECITANKGAWLTTLLATGPGLEENGGRPWKHGLFTLLAFVLAGTFPLIPYLIGPMSNRFLISSVMAGTALFVTGALRTLITGVNWLRSGMEMLAVGSAAAVVAYGAGHVVALFS